jgi:hypothetical protein
MAEGLRRMTEKAESFFLTSVRPSLCRTLDCNFNSGIETSFHGQVTFFPYTQSFLNWYYVRFTVMCKGVSFHCAEISWRRHEHGIKRVIPLKQRLWERSTELRNQNKNWRASSSGIWRRVVHWVSTDVSEEHIASIFRVEEIGSANQRASRWKNKNYSNKRLSEFKGDNFWSETYFLAAFVNLLMSICPFDTYFYHERLYDGTLNSQIFLKFDMNCMPFEATRIWGSIL